MRLVDEGYGTPSDIEEWTLDEYLDAHEYLEVKAEAQQFYDNQK